MIILNILNYIVISDLTPLRDSSVQQREFSTNIMSLVDISKVNTTITKPLSFSDKKFHSIAIVVSGQLAGGARGLTRYVWPPQHSNRLYKSCYFTDQRRILSKLTCPTSHFLTHLLGCTQRGIWAGIYSLCESRGEGHTQSTLFRINYIFFGAF